MTFPDIKLVDAPTSTATVLFDFNDTTATPAREVLAENFSIGVPELIGDVDAIDPLYTERVVTFTCRMTGTKAQVVGAQSTLARRLLANGQGWLQVRMTSTSRLLFFRTYRAQPGDLSLELLQGVSTTKRERWDLDVAIPCEPFIYGERVTQSAKLVNQNPESGGNYPTYFLLDSMIGDAPTPLRLRITSSSAFTGRNAIMVATHVAPDAQAPTRINIGTGDGTTNSADVTLTTGDSAYTGGSYRRVAFTSTPSFITFNGIGAAPGRYKILARVTMADTTTVATITPVQDILMSAGSVSVTGDPVRVSSAVGSGGTWVNLGEMSFPFRSPRNPADLPFQVNARFTMRFARLAGAGTMAVDHLILVPVSTATTQSARTLVVDGTNMFDITDRALTIDADTSDAWVSVASTGALVDGAPSIAGSFPEAIPGSLNFIEVLFSTNATAPADAIARNLTVTASYYPRWLYWGDS